MNSLTNWLCWKFQSHWWEFSTEQEVTHGRNEVFPFTLGTREIVIKVGVQMMYFRICAKQAYDLILLYDGAVLGILEGFFY